MQTFSCFRQHECVQGGHWLHASSGHSLPLTLTHSLSLILTHSHPLNLTHSHSLSLSLTHSLSLIPTYSEDSTSCVLHSRREGSCTREHRAVAKLGTKRLSHVLATMIESGLCYLGGGHTWQQDVEVSPAQSRISPSIQLILRKVNETLPNIVNALTKLLPFATTSFCCVAYR